MEVTATATRPASRRPIKADREVALRLGALVVHMMSFGGARGVVKALDCTGLSFVQMKALAIVGADADAETSVKYVAESLGTSLPSASRAVDGLVKKGLATRVEAAADRRVRHISLTDEGQLLVDEIVSTRIEGMERFIAELTTEERGKLDAALAVLLERDDMKEIYRAQKRRVSE